MCCHFFKLTLDIAYFLRLFYKIVAQLQRSAYFFILGLIRFLSYLRNSLLSVVVFVLHFFYRIDSFNGTFLSYIFIGLTPMFHSVLHFRLTFYIGLILF